MPFRYSARLGRVEWADAQAYQGSPVTVPSGLANALFIVADNMVRLAINAGLRGPEPKGKSYAPSPSPSSCIRRSRIVPATPQPRVTYRTNRVQPPRFTEK